MKRKSLIFVLFLLFFKPFCAYGAAAQVQRMASSLGAHLGQKATSLLKAAQSIKTPSRQDIAAMKRFLNVKKNYACLRRGEGCSKAERASLAAIDTIVAAATAALTAKGAKEGYRWHIRRQAGEYGLFEAARIGDVEEVKRLLWAGADVNAVDNYGWTALLHAANGEHKDTVELLLKAGADVRAAHDATNMALVHAVSRGDKDRAELLLDAGADVDAVDRYGETVLMGAATEGHTDIVELLLKAGADVDVVVGGEDGWTAEKFAHDAGYTHIVDLIQNHRLRRLTKSSRKR